VLSDLWSLCRCKAFHPHFLAVAAALVTAARERRLVSATVDFPDDEEFSRLGLFPKESNGFVDGASELNETLLALAGLGGEESAIEPLTESETLMDACGVKLFSKSCSGADPREDTEDWLPAFWVLERRDGEPTGVWAGEVDWERAEIAAIALVA
jgi:hypothetical protein